MNKKITISGEEQTRHESLSDAEKRRYEEIVQIQNYLAQGYAPKAIRDLMKTSYKRIRRYATGDPYKMCLYGSGKRASILDPYRSVIIDCLEKNIPRKEILFQITDLGFNGKLTIFNNYCKKLIEELSIDYASKRNAAGVKIDHDKKTKVHYVTNSELFKFLWSGKEIDNDDAGYMMKKYPNLQEIEQCIQDFRNIYTEDNIELLDSFITTYSKSSIKQIASFANGLKMDYEAIKNSVASPLSNGFVEGINNKVKVVKRMMYGRAKLLLLRAKLILSG